MYTLSLLLLIPLSVMAQTVPQQSVPVIHDVAVTVSSKTYHKIQQGITWEDLNPIDLVGLKNREQVERVHEYLDGDFNPVRTYETISHTNAHPKWYDVPALVSYGSDGIHFQMDPSGPGLNDRFIKYDSEDSISYLEAKQLATENGFLAGYTFSFPNSDQITSASMMYDEISWSEDGQSVTFIADSRSDTWDQQKKMKVSITPQSSGNGFLRTTQYYTFDETYQMDLLRAVVLDRDIILDGGICGKEITIEEYSNYTIDAHGANPRSDAVSPLVNFTVYPNPLRNDLMTIKVPPSFIGQEILARVVNVTGNPLYEVYLSFSSEKQTIRLNVDQYPEGLYFLQLNMADSTHAKSFYITK